MTPSLAIMSGVGLYSRATVAAFGVKMWCLASLGAALGLMEGNDAATDPSKSYAPITYENGVLCTSHGCESILADATVATSINALDVAIEQYIDFLFQFAFYTAQIFNQWAYAASESQVEGAMVLLEVGLIVPIAIMAWALLDTYSEVKVVFSR